MIIAYQLATLNFQDELLNYHLVKNIAATHPGTHRIL